MYKILQTSGGKETVIGSDISIESATCFAEHRHMVAGADRTRVVGQNGRTAKDRDGREWDWIKK